MFTKAKAIVIKKKKKSKSNVQHQTFMRICSDVKDLMLIAFQELNDILHRQVSNVHES